MIIIGRTDEMKEMYDENWMIVRSPEEIPAYAKQVAALSPTKELFTWYRETVHKDAFTRQWFDEVYVPQFLSDLLVNKEALSLLESLCEMSRKKDIFLCCYCLDETLCHRSIIGGVLLGMGAEINAKQEYIKYYEQLKQRL